MRSDRSNANDFKVHRRLARLQHAGVDRPDGFPDLRDDVLHHGAKVLVDGKAIDIGKPLIYAGLVPMFVGVALAVVASRQFSSVGTNIIPLSQSSALVTDGAFNWMRNPMYTGMLAFLAGLALLLDNLIVWLVVVAFFVLIRQLFVMREEQLMQQTFGDDYIAYSRNAGSARTDALGVIADNTYFSVTITPDAGKSISLTSISFDAMAGIANAEDHHPDFSAGYNYCLVNYTTHAIGGLSENDFICAAKLNKLL